MSFNYKAMGDLGVRLLSKFGQSIILVRKSGSSVDPITGAIAAGTINSVTTTGVLNTYSDSVVDGSRILTGDKKLILSNEQAVTMTDKPTIDGESWSIVNIKTIKKANDVIVYYCQVRK